MKEIEELKEDLKNLKKELKIEIDSRKLEVANIKANYLTNIIILIGFIFYYINPNLKIWGYDSVYYFYLFILIVGAWFWKDMLLYSNFLVKKIIGMK